MDIAYKLEKLLPQWEQVEKMFAGRPTETVIFAKVHQVFATSKTPDRVGLADDLKHSLLLARALKDRMWEIINTGHYSSVNNIDRQVFTLVTAYKVSLLLLQLKDTQTPATKIIEDCIYDLDYGLLLGCPLDGENNDILTSCLDEVRKYLLPEADAELNQTQSCASKIRPSSEYSNSSVDILNCPSIDIFQQNHFLKRKPAILTHCMDQWPALTKWSNPNYLIQMAGERTVPIEIGSHYTNEDWSQDLVKFKDFIRRHFMDDVVLSEANRVEYLAQHNLFDQIPKLKGDILVPEYCCVSESNGAHVQQDIKAWLGPKGTISPMHHDPKHNLLCQIFGHKRIILAAPEDSENLYPHEGDMLSNTSLLDAENVNLAEFPLAANVKFYSITLYKGEILYIPPKWWHYVRSLDRSFSVSFWWE